jgi:hypothetical protein
VQTGLGEALDIFRKWFSEGALIRCDFSFLAFAVSLRGRVRLVGDTDVTIVSDDADSEMVCRLGKAVRFEFTDPRRFPEEASVFDFSIVTFLSDVGDKHEFIAFSQIIENEAEKKK